MTTHTERRTLDEHTDDSGEPVWSKIETHCVVCARPFATDADSERHAEKECDDPCWCVSVCWVNWGGDCIPSAEVGTHWGADEMRLYSLYRAWRERAETLEAHRG